MKLQTYSAHSAITLDQLISERLGFKLCETEIWSGDTVYFYLDPDGQPVEAFQPDRMLYLPEQNLTVEAFNTKGMLIMRGLPSWANRVDRAFDLIPPLYEGGPMYTIQPQMPNGFLILWDHNGQECSIVRTALARTVCEFWLNWTDQKESK